MDRPKEKRLLTVTQAINTDPTHSIHFDYTVQGLADKLKDFGTLHASKGTGFLDVNRCYDYGEVLRYIEFLGKEKPEKKEKPIRIRWTKNNFPLTMLPKEHTRAIGFYCTDARAVNQLRYFGVVYHWSEDRSECAYLVVGPHYAYNEVLQYMEEYPNKEKPKQGSWPFPLTEKKADRRYATGSAASMCFSCKLLECPYRWSHQMNINTQGFMACPFRERLEE